MKKINEFSFRSRSDSVSRIFLISIWCTGLLPFVPQIDDPAVYLFGIAFSVVGGLAAVEFIRAPRLDRYGFCIFLFLLYLIGNSLVALINNVGLDDWFRGFAPFIFFTTYIIAEKVYIGAYEQLHSAIWIASLLWAGRLIFSAGAAVFDVLGGNLGRLSYVATEALIPFGMVGFVLSLSHLGLGKMQRYGFAAIFFLLVVMIGYRSQIAICVIVLIAWIFIYGSAKATFVIALAAIPFCVIFFDGINLPVLGSAFGRFETISEEKTGVRSSELGYALEKFQESPVLGKGLSFPIPVELTREGEILGSFEVSEVRYMHNIAGYFLMDTGIVGFALISVLFYFVARKIGKNWRRLKKSPHLMGIALAWISISIFFFVSASFRQVQTIAIYSLMSYMIIKGLNRREV